MSVAASTHDLNLPSRLVDMAGAVAAAPAPIPGKSVARGTGVAPIVYAPGRRDRYALTVTSFTQGGHGTGAASDGRLVYTHDGSSTVPDLFTYTVSDGVAKAEGG